MTDKKSLFRKKALLHAARPDQYDQLIRIVPARQWLVLLLVIAVLVAAIIWSIIATVPVRVEGQGLLLSEQGAIYAATAPNGAGHITRILVKNGDKVSKDQVIATLKRPDLVKEIDVSQAYIQTLEKNYHETSDLAQREITQHNLSINKQKRALNDRLASERSNLKYIKELLKIRQQAHKRGLESKQDVMRSLNEYYGSQARLEGLNEAIAQNKINAVNFNDRWQQRLRDLQQQLRNEKRNLANQQQRLDISQTVHSPVTGVVTSIAKNIGDIANSGDIVARIASLAQGMDAILFLKPEDGKRVKAGMQALVSPTTIKREEFGSIYADVVSVSQFPVTHETMMAILHNENLIRQLAGNFSPIIVRVRLHPDTKTPSGYAWSSSLGPKQQITPGTAASARVIVRRQPPISLIIPAVKKFLGFDA